MKNKTKQLSFLISSFLLSCNPIVGKDYVEPEINLPDKFLKNGSSTNLKVESVENGELPKEFKWIAEIKNPQLNELVVLALNENYDLKLSAIDIVNRKLSVKSLYSNLYPTIDYNLSATRQSGVVQGIGQKIAPINIFSNNIIIGWELDIFGGSRRAVESADALVESSKYQAESASLVVVGEIFDLYVALLRLNSSVQISEQDLATQKDVVSLISSRKAFANELEIVEAESVLSSLKVSNEQLNKQRSETILKLARVSNLSVDYFSKFTTLQFINIVTPELPELGIPAELLRKRPDLRSLERVVAARSADVGVSEAALYPRLSLSGNLGLRGHESGDIFDLNQRAWNIGSTFGWNILDWGKRKIGVKVSENLLEESIINYQKAAVSAYIEVEDLANTLDSLNRELKLQRELVAANERTFQITKIQFEAGLIDYFRVADAIQNYSKSKLTLLERQQIYLSTWSALHRAVGIFL